MTIIKKDHYDAYWIKLSIAAIVVLCLLYGITNKLYTSSKVENFTAPVILKKPIYILKSYTTALVYAKNSAENSTYVNQLNKFKKMVSDTGYNPKFIEEDKLNRLKKDDILLLIDAVALSDKIRLKIKNFIKNGGSCFFNFTTAFSDEHSNYLGATFVEDITGLKMSEKRPMVTFSESIFMTTKMLSPFSQFLDNSKIMDAVFYDQIPIYFSTQENKPDIMMVTYGQLNSSKTKEKKSNLTQEESGFGWHGYYGKGKWAYVSFPSYVFYNMPDWRVEFKKILHGVLDYLTSNIVVEKFPYIDQDHVVFVSEDTEYKFKNFARFADLSKKYSIPVTAFIVATLAKKEKHRAMMEDIGRNKFIEYGSHSYSHKKIVGESRNFVENEIAGSKRILDPYTKAPVIGFRPPREELDDVMIKKLATSGYKYILGSYQGYLYPTFDKNEKELLIIPRHGTDDYNYLINLDWDQEKILSQIIKEAQFITYLNGIYTLSVHTHLFSYDTNINIIRDFYKFLKQNPDLKPLSGSGIYQRVVQNSNIALSYKESLKNVVITIENNNKKSVKNFHMKIFKNPWLVINRISSSDPDVHINSDNLSQKELTIGLNNLKPKSITMITIHFKEL
jgi:peptidoglycan/xylan/chitin deacetylase (PgdA/CDA1 family)